MKRYGEFLTSDEDKMFVEAVRTYIDKEVMPVRGALDEDYSVFEKVTKVSFILVFKKEDSQSVTVVWGFVLLSRFVPLPKRFLEVTLVCHCIVSWFLGHYLRRWAHVTNT